MQHIRMTLEQARAVTVEAQQILDGAPEGKEIVLAQHKTGEVRMYVVPTGSRVRLIERDEL